MSSHSAIAGEPRRSFAGAAFSAQIALLVLLCLYLTWIQRYLFADGSYFVWHLLETRSVFDWFPARRFSHLLTQLPTVFAMRVLHCRNLPALSALYGATMFLMPIAGPLAAAWAGRTAPANFLAIPLLCASLLTLTTSFVIFHEAWVAVALFWCALSLLLHSPRLTATRGVVLLAVSALATRTFESYLFLSMPLAAAAWLRLVAARRRGARFDMAACAACLMINVTGTILAAMEIHSPRDPANRSTFLEGLGMHLGSPAVVLSLAYLLAFIVFSLCRPTSRVLRAGQMTALLLAAAALGVGLIPFLAPQSIRPESQYGARVQFVYVPLLLGVLAVFLEHGKSDRRAGFITERPDLWKLTMGLTLGAVLFHVGAGREWARFRDALRDDAARDRGVISFGDSAIGESRMRKDATEFDATRLTQFSWSWTTPTLSALSGALEFGRVGTVIENERPVVWQPFDPRDMGAYRWLEEYGVEVRVGGSAAGDDSPP
jgi:hypothetical protein